jgi:toxin ParE1/3/4
VKVVWTEQALVRLGEIQDFIGAANPEAAGRLVDRIIERGDRLARFPNMGRLVAELPGTGIREIVEGRYRIVYRIRPRFIEVLTVFEGHRQFPADDVDE